jgi:collagenase-like PrtC family protease
LQKMNFFMDKVDAISLPDAVNRNFTLLKTFPTQKIKIELLANNLCLLDCPIGAYHANYASHNSQCINPTISRLDEYPMMWCTTEKINHPLELIKSPWIRPEDIKVYEKIGFTHFKISGREKSTDWIVQRVKAYSERSYSGNVLDFLNPFLFFYPKHTPEIFIDNTKLEGFISFFEEEQCDKYCDKCTHCKHYYDRSVSITGDVERYKRFVRSRIERLEEVRD